MPLKISVKKTAKTAKKPAKKASKKVTCKLLYFNCEVHDMKKHFFLLSFALLLLLISCNLQMPSAVQIKGSPDLKFSANFGMSDYLKEFIEEEDFKKDAKDQGIELLDCGETSVVTYLVYMKLYDEKITLDTSITGSSGDYNATSDVTLVPASGLSYEELEVPALNFADDFKGFLFNQDKIFSKLYISGSPIVGGLSVELKIDNGNSQQSSEKGNRTSGLNGKTTYYGNELPTGGTKINLPFNGNKFIINYKIFVKAGDTIKKEWMEGDTSVLVELAIWLPFEFIADKDETELDLPDDLFGEGDLFGRESSSDDNTVTEMLESLNFAMKMNASPFTGATLNVNSKGINIDSPIKGASLEFALNEQNMKVINRPENIPFSPKLKLVFNKGGAISFLRDLTITEISFSARLNHTIDLSGNVD
jgi:hypothetical protein